MKVVPGLLFIILITAGKTYAQERSLDSLLKQNLRNEYFKINMLMQTEGRYSIGDEKLYGGSQFSVANARISFRGNLDNGFFYRLYTNFSSEPELLDAFIGYKFGEGLRITTGQMKPKQTLDYIPNPGATDFIDRALITGKVVASRELGMAVDGNTGNFYYYGGMFNGQNQLDNSDKNNLYFIGRLQYTFRHLLPGFVQVAVYGSHGGSAYGQMGSSGAAVLGDRTVYGADFRFESYRWIFAAEYLAGEYTNQNAASDEEIEGYYATLGYNLNDYIAVLSRWQNYHLENEEYYPFDISSDMLTVGINIQTTEFISFQVNAEMLMPDLPDKKDNQFGLSGVFQLQF